MGAFATVTIPLDFTSPGSSGAALREGETSAGSTEVAITPTGLTLKLQLPGNLRALTSRLRGQGLAVPETVGVSVPVRAMGIPDLVPNVEHLLQTLNESGEVFGAQMDGDNVTAQVKPTSNKGLYRLFYAIIHEGLMPQDTPTLPALRGL
jgi:hypothetical protein